MRAFVSLTETLVRIVLVALLAAMTGTVLLQIVLRYFFERPLPGAEELTRYMFVYLIFLGAAVGIRTGVHVSIDVLVRRLPGKIGPSLDTVATMIVGAFLLFLVVYGTQMALNTMTQSSPALGIPIGYAYFAVPAGGLLGLLFLVTPKPARGPSNEEVAA